MTPNVLRLIPSSLVGTEAVEPVPTKVILTSSLAESAAILLCDERTALLEK